METLKSEPGQARFVGRRAELEFFYNRLRAAVRQREPEIITLNGPAGIGKTRLIEELIRRVEGRGRPVRVYRLELARGESQSALRQVVWARFALSVDDSAEAQLAKIRHGLMQIVGRERLADAQRFVATIAGVTVDQYGQAFPGMSPELVTNPQFQARAVKTVLNLLRYDATSTPHLWAFEDWDRATSAQDIDVLRELMERLGSRMACIVISTQTPLTLDGLQASHFNLEPLSFEATSELLRGCVENVESLPSGFVSDTARKCAGNPRLALELVRLFQSQKVLSVDETGEWRFQLDDYAKESVPEDIHTTIRQRYDQLSDFERLLLQRIHRFGDTAWVDGVVSMCRALDDVRPPTEAGDEVRRTIVRANDALIDSGQVALADDHLFRGVRSIRIASSELRDSLPERPADLARTEHAVIAQWIVSRKSREPARSRRLAVEHWLAAKRPDRAVEPAIEWLSSAAGSELDDAMAFAESTLEGLGPADAHAKIRLLRGAIKRALVTQRPDSASLLLDSLAQEVAVLDDETGHASMLMMRGECALIAGRLGAAKAYLDRARLTWDTLGDRAGRADTLERKAAAIAYGGGADALQSAIDILDTVVSLRRELDIDGALAASLVRLGEFRVQSGDLQSARAALSEALDLTQDRLPLVRARGYASQAELHWEAGEPADAESSWDKALYLAHEGGDIVGVARIRLSKAEPLVAARRAHEAREEAVSVLELAREFGRKDLEARAESLLSSAALAEGKEEEARYHADNALQCAEGIGRQVEISRALLARALACANALFITPGASPEAVGSASEDFSRAATLLDEMGERPLLIKVLSAHGRHLLEQGQEAPGNRQLERARELRLTLRSDAAEEKAFHAARTIRRTYHSGPISLEDLETVIRTSEKPA